MSYPNPCPEHPEIMVPPGAVCAKCANTPKVDGGGLRHNTGKAQVGLISGIHDLYLARVTEAGMGKYPKHNWRRGMKWSTLLDCIGRHFNALRGGEFYDEDKTDPVTGELIEKGMCCPHAAIIAWNCMALLEYMHTYPEGNDLYVAPGTVAFAEGELRQGTYMLPEPEEIEPVEDCGSCPRCRRPLDSVADRKCAGCGVTFYVGAAGYAEDAPRNRADDTEARACPACDEMEVRPELRPKVDHTCILGTAHERAVPPDPGTFYQTDGSIQTLDPMPESNNDPRCDRCDCILFQHKSVRAGRCACCRSAALGHEG